MALAGARRASDAQTPWQRAFQVFRRALTLVLLGVFLRSLGAAHTRWVFTDTLSQLGLGYGFLYLLSRRSARAQWEALAAILVGYWLAFALYPLPSADFDWAGHVESHFRQDRLEDVAVAQAPFAEQRLRENFHTLLAGAAAITTPWIGWYGSISRRRADLGSGATSTFCDVASVLDVENPFGTTIRSHRRAGTIAVWTSSTWRHAVSVGAGLAFWSQYPVTTRASCRAPSPRGVRRLCCAAQSRGG
jgi:hypothetical protein